MDQFDLFSIGKKWKSCNRFVIISNFSMMHIHVWKAPRERYVGVYVLYMCCNSSSHSNAGACVCVKAIENFKFLFDLCVCICMCCHQKVFVFSLKLDLLCKFCWIPISNCTIYRLLECFIYKLCQCDVWLVEINWPHNPLSWDASFETVFYLPDEFCTRCSVAPSLKSILKFRSAHFISFLYQRNSNCFTFLTPFEYANYTVKMLRIMCRIASSLSLWFR